MKTRHYRHDGRYRLFHCSGLVLASKVFENPLLSTPIYIGCVLEHIFRLLMFVVLVSVMVKRWSTELAVKSIRAAQTIKQG